MHRLLTVLLLISLAAPCRAAYEPKPTTLTPDEIAEGWILLFDGETTLGWKTQGTVRTREGSLVLSGDRETSVQTSCEFGSDFIVKFEYRNNNREALVHAGVTWKEGSGWWHTSSLARAEGEWAQGSITMSYDMKKRTYLSTITSRAKDSGGSGTREPGSPVERSNWGIGFVAPGGSTLELRRIRLKPVGLKPIFNGEDLSGWKKFEVDPKRAKSQFSVTKDGWLSIQNGPGDLQTTGEWSDFVLQLDCRTNGDNLNSGVFFRCIPGQYQNGYEAQIQNRPAKQPKTYTIEEYDPKTHKLASKKKIENWSQDYGTGAIYRRIPARRAAAKDREWFTMTVAARGRHLATWVNGVQTVDWTDNRPENENARNGCRLKKGPISLQGHDPTTDLSFRNIRIADLGEKNQQ